MELDGYFKSAFSVDCVVFGLDEGQLKVLLIKRGAEPYEGQFAIPGDLVKPEEDLDDASIRVLHDLTGLKRVYMEQIGAFGAPDRHPFGRVITVAYYSLINTADYKVNASSWALQADWHEVASLPDLAFDHSQIVASAKQQLREKVKREPIGFELLPRRFTLTQLQSLYEAILEQKFDKRNFRKKLLSMQVLRDTKELQKMVSHRPAKLFEFDQKKYTALKKRGLGFEL